MILKLIILLSTFCREDVEEPEFVFRHEAYTFIPQMTLKFYENQMEFKDEDEDTTEG